MEWNKKICNEKRGFFLTNVEEAHFGSCGIDCGDIFLKTAVRKLWLSAEYNFYYMCSLNAFYICTSYFFQWLIDEALKILYKFKICSLGWSDRTEGRVLVLHMVNPVWIQSLVSHLVPWASRSDSKCKVKSNPWAL